MRLPWRRARLSPAPSPDASRAIAWGDQLVKVHSWLLNELATAREQLSSQQTPVLSAGLVAHCMSFCDALDAHHRGEDDGMFPYLEAEDPALRTTIERLRREHVTVGRIVREVRDLLTAGSDATQNEVATRIDDLIEQLTSHFANEEQELTQALNSLKSLPWSDSD
jgi:hemerythrin-like domain-containing protein